MESAASLKFSPEDPQGSRRRKRQDAGSDKWVKSLPTPGRMMLLEQSQGSLA